MCLRIQLFRRLRTKVAVSIAITASAMFLAGCEPEVGSEDWCADIREKGATNVTASEVADFAKHCVL